MSVFYGVLNVMTSQHPLKQDVPRYNYGKGNYYDCMINYFNGICWSEVLSSSTIHDNWKVFKEVVLGAMGKYIPHLCSQETKKNFHHHESL